MTERQLEVAIARRRSCSPGSSGCGWSTVGGVGAAGARRCSAIVAALAYTGGPFPYGYRGAGRGVRVRVLRPRGGRRDGVPPGAAARRRCSWPRRSRRARSITAILVVNNLRDIPTRTPRPASGRSRWCSGSAGRQAEYGALLGIAYVGAGAARCWRGSLGATAGRRRRGRRVRRRAAAVDAAARPAAAADRRDVRASRASSTSCSRGRRGCRSCSGCCSRSGWRSCGSAGVAGDDVTSRSASGARPASRSACRSRPPPGTWAARESLLVELRLRGRARAGVGRGADRRVRCDGGPRGARPGDCSTGRRRRRARRTSGTRSRAGLGGAVLDLAVAARAGRERRCGRGSASTPRSRRGRASTDGRVVAAAAVGAGLPDAQAQGRRRARRRGRSRIGSAAVRPAVGDDGSRSGSTRTGRGTSRARWSGSRRSRRFGIQYVEQPLPRRRPRRRGASCGRRSASRSRPTRRSTSPDAARALVEQERRGRPRRQAGAGRRAGGGRRDRVGRGRGTASRS